MFRENVGHPEVNPSIRSAIRAPGHCVLRRGQGLPPLSPHPFSASGALPPLRSGQVFLDEAEYFLHNRGASFAALRWCSGSSRNPVRLPLSAGGVADEWVTQLLRQGDAKAFKKYSQMKLQMKREALQKLNRKANEGRPGFDTERPN